MVPELVLTFLRNRNWCSRWPGTRNYTLQGEDVHLFLARLSFEIDDHEGALGHVKAARSLAICDGHPNYIYKVAHDEAGMLLSFLEK